MTEFPVRFTVKGEPMSKARARVVNGHAFTPLRTRQAEDVVAWSFRDVARGHEPTATVYYGVSAEFYAGTRQRRDVDNMLKLILDGLNGVAWVDDNSVLEVFGRKSYCTKAEARTEVCIYEVGSPAHLSTFTCAGCGSTVPSYPSVMEKKKYCSTECWRRTVAGSGFKACVACGTEFRNHRSLYCSAACKHEHKTVDVACTQCATMFNRSQSWVTNGKPFCTIDCRVAWHREHRAIAARGVCATCAGSTSKKCYVRCQACAIEASRQ